MKLNEPTPVTVTLDWEQIQALSKFYEFPSVVFFMDKSTMLNSLKRTRKENKSKRLEKLKEQLDDIFEQLKEW